MDGSEAKRLGDGLDSIATGETGNEEGSQISGPCKWMDGGIIY